MGVVCRPLGQEALAKQHRREWPIGGSGQGQSHLRRWQQSELMSEENSERGKIGESAASREYLQPLGFARRKRENRSGKRSMELAETESRAQGPQHFFPSQESGPSCCLSTEGRGSSMIRRETAPSRAGAWPGSEQELPPKGTVVTYKLCPFFLLCPWAGFGIHRVFQGQDWYSLCPQREEYKAQESWPGPGWTCYFPERRVGCEAHGCFWAEIQFLAPTFHGCQVEWALDKGKQRVSTYAKKGVQCQNLGPSAIAGVSDFGEGRREKWLDIEV